MIRAIAIGSAIAMLAIPATAGAKPTQADRSQAAKECRAERGGTPATQEAFRDKYGTNHNKRNAFGKCVARRAVDEENEGDAAHSNAAKECKAERGETGNEAFTAKYGSGKNGRNAYGKCVSAKAKEHEQEADADDMADIAETKSAAKACAAERRDIGRDAFADKYGTNHNKRNAFGKCVSATVKAEDEDDDAQS